MEKCRRKPRDLGHQICNKIVDQMRQKHSQNDHRRTLPNQNFSLMHFFQCFVISFRPNVGLIWPHLTFLAGGVQTGLNLGLDGHPIGQARLDTPITGGSISKSLNRFAGNQLGNPNQLAAKWLDKVGKNRLNFDNEKTKIDENISKGPKYTQR